MRLLNIRTLPLLDFVEVLCPEEAKYAILSHTWGTEEVTLEDLHKPESKQLQGYKKMSAAVSRQTMTAMTTSG